MTTRRKEQLESWHKDKAVQDNIVESWLCVDCGVNTLPGCPSGPELRIDIALKGASGVSFDHHTEVYAVKDSIWKQSGMRPWSGCLCVGCLEKRLGRQLRPRDFSRHDREVYCALAMHRTPPQSARLRDRDGADQGPAAENHMRPGGRPSHRGHVHG